MSIETTTDGGTVSKPLPWHHWVEPWYLTYALLGATIAGLIPILLPLVASRGGGATVGLVMAAFNLGGMAAPLWGEIADRFKLHIQLLAGGLILTTLGLALFPISSTLSAWMGLALVQGVGAAAANTVANLFIVEVHPKPEWDARIGWLQTFYGAGQVVGLLIAGILGQASSQAGLWVAAGVTAMSFLLSLVTRHPVSEKSAVRPVLMHPVRHTDWPVSSPQRSYHHLDPGTIRASWAAINSPLGIFLASWLLSFGGAAAVFSLYPVLMAKVFGVNPGISSLGFAIAAGLGLLLYAPAGRWSDRFGAGIVLKSGLITRIVAFLILALVGLSYPTLQKSFTLAPNSINWVNLLAVLAFILVVLAWSLISVSSTAMVARLTTVGEGAGIGIFNATTAIAGVIGSAVGGWLAGFSGYNAASILAIAGVVLGLVLLMGSKGS